MPSNGDLYGIGVGGTAGTPGTLNLPEPPRENWTRTIVPKGARTDLANGGVVWDSIGYKQKWDLSWTLVTSTTRNNLEQTFRAITGPVGFVDWEGNNASIQPLLDTLAIVPVTLADGSTRRYNVRITFEGV